MAYNEFAYFYDEFNGEADYDALYGYITDELKAHGITDGILADLGCGTGDLTLMLTQAGYDVIGIDRSEEMLSVLREKADELGLTGRLLLLKQDLLDLDLYGTIRAAVSTFDTYSHIGPQENFEKAIRKAAYFMERGGVFIAMKGSGADEEIDAAQGAVAKLGGKYAGRQDVTLPDGSARTLILYEKISQTPPVYPRNGGKIAKAPLK